LFYFSDLEDDETIPIEVKQNFYCQDLIVSNELEYFILENVQSGVLSHKFENKELMFSTHSVLSRWTDPIFWYQFFLKETDESNESGHQNMNYFSDIYNNRLPLKYLALYVHLTIIEFWSNSNSENYEIQEAIKLFLPTLLNENRIDLAAKYALKFTKSPADEMANAFSILGQFTKELLERCLEIDSVIFVDLGLKVKKQIFNFDYQCGSIERRRSIVLDAISWVRKGKKGEVALDAVYTLIHFRDLKGASEAYDKYEKWKGNIKNENFVVSKTEMNLWEKIKILAQRIEESNDVKSAIEDTFKAVMAWSDEPAEIRSVQERREDAIERKEDIIENIISLLVQMYEK